VLVARTREAQKVQKYLQAVQTARSGTRSDTPTRACASKPTTTLAIYTHLFNTDDHAGAMAALGAMAAGPNYGTNVVPLHG
jgi:hypothetical protein